MKYLIILASLPLLAGEPLPLPITLHGASQSRLHLERTVIDMEKGKSHSSYETYDYSTTGDPEDAANNIADLTAAIYFKNSHYPLREYISSALQKKIAAAKLAAPAEEGTKSSLDALEALVKQRHSLNSSIDLAHKDTKVSSFIHKTVMEAIEDAFVEKDNEISRKERSKKEIADSLLEQRGMTKMVAWGHLANSLVSAGITAGIILASIYGNKS